MRTKSSKLDTFARAVLKANRKAGYKLVIPLPVAVGCLRAHHRKIERLVRRALPLHVVPTNWCDPLLTGKDAVLKGTRSYSNLDIEILLGEVGKRYQQACTDLLAALKEMRR